MNVYEKKVQQMKKNNPFINNTDIAYELILEKILEGILEPGNKVKQEEMAELFNMSRSPIREAIHRLEKEGFLVKGNIGYEVYTLQIKDYLEFSEFKINLESYCAYLAARYITANQSELLKNNIEQMNEAINKEDLSKVVELDSEFHDVIVESASNQYLKESYKLFEKKNKFYRKMIVKRDNIQSIFIKHKKIYGHILEKNENGALEEMKSHLSFTLRAALRL